MITYPKESRAYLQNGLTISTASFLNKGRQVERQKKNEKRKDTWSKINDKRKSSVKYTEAVKSRDSVIFCRGVRCVRKN